MAIDPDRLNLQAELWLSMDGRNLVGARRLTLLNEILRVGSLTHAAKAAGLSYKGAWDAIEAMSSVTGAPLLERVAGGKGGGHTRLTLRGERLLHHFALIQREHARFVDGLSRRLAALTADDLISHTNRTHRTNMKTSARNQFAGTVRAVKSGAINDEVELEVDGGLRVVATVTRESCEELGLQPGAKAFALVKASSVILLTDADGVRLSARNQFVGTVSKVTPGAVNTEVVLDLAGGGTVAAVITNDSAQTLAIENGSAATAVFKASSVIVGVGA